MIRRRGSAGREPTRGQTLVEMALILPIFLLVVIGLFDVGRAVWNYNTLAQSAREGVRVAAVETNWVGKTGAACTTPTCPANTTQLKAHIVTAANRVVGLDTLPDSAVVVRCGATVNCSANNASGNTVTVTVSFTFQPVINLFSIPMSASATMVIN